MGDNYFLIANLIDLITSFQPLMHNPFLLTEGYLLGKKNLQSFNL